MAAIYPANTFKESVDLTIEAANQIAQVVRGSGNTEIMVEDGSTIPSVRKALLDNFFFKSPADWITGEKEDTFNQLRRFTDGSLWYAKSATKSTNVPMGSSPYGDDNWTIFPYSGYSNFVYTAEGGETVISTGKSFNTCSLSIDGLVQTPEISYTVDNGNITFKESLITGEIIIISYPTYQANIPSMSTSNSQESFKSLGIILSTQTNFIQVNVVFTSMLVFVDGVLQNVNTNYSISNNVITFSESLPANTSIHLIYQ